MEERSLELIWITEGFLGVADKWGKKERNIHREVAMGD